MVYLSHQWPNIMRVNDVCSALFTRNPSRFIASMASPLRLRIRELGSQFSSSSSSSSWLYSERKAFLSEGQCDLSVTKGRIEISRVTLVLGRGCTGGII